MWLLWDEIIFFQLAPNALLIIMRVYLNKWTCTKCAYYNKKIIRKVCRTYLSGKMKFCSYIFPRSRRGGGAIRKTFFRVHYRILPFIFIISVNKTLYCFCLQGGGERNRQKIFTMSAESWGKICEHELVCTLTNKITTFSLSLSGIVH